MRQWWGWIVAISLVVLSFVLLIWQRSRGRTIDATHTAVAIAEAWHGQAIATKQAKIKELRQADTVDAAKVKELKTSISKHKEMIERSYVSSGMSAAEIAARFRKLPR